MSCNVKSTGNIGSFDWLVKSSAEKNKEDENVDTVFFCDKYKYELYKEEEIGEDYRLTLSDAEHINSLDDPRLMIKPSDPLGVVYTKSEVFQLVKDRLEGKEKKDKDTNKPLTLADAKSITDPDDPRLKIKSEDSFMEKALKYAILSIVKSNSAKFEDDEKSKDKQAKAFAVA